MEANRMTKNEIAKYWIDSSEVDFQAMDNLFSNGHYVWALFIVKARYPDYKNRFYKKATSEFAQVYINRIKEFKQWLVSKISN